MALKNFLTGNSSVDSNSKYIDEYLTEGEVVEYVYRTVRDEVVFTTFGIYIIDVQGVTGSKKSLHYNTFEDLVSVEFETAGMGIDDAEVTLIFRYGHNHKIEFNKSNAEVAKQLFMHVKDVLIKK